MLPALRGVGCSSLQLRRFRKMRTEYIVFFVEMRETTMKQHTARVMQYVQLLIGVHLHSPAASYRHSTGLPCVRLSPPTSHAAST